MVIDENYKGQVRIVNEGVVGGCTTVIDSESGEMIVNIFRAVINLDVEEFNIAQLTFYASDEQGKPLLDENKKLMQGTVQVKDSLVNLQAYARRTQPR